MERNRLQDIMNYRNLANTDPMKLMQLQNQMEMPMVNRAIGSQVGMPEENKPLADPTSVSDGLKKLVPLAIAQMATMVVGDEVQKDLDELDREDAELNLNMNANPLFQFAGEPVNNMIGQGQAVEQGQLPEEEATGLMQLAARGGGVDNFAGQVPGQGHGMEDNVYMPIVERNRGQQVATLAVSPDEYVVDAHTMSALGNGSADEGARYMDGMVKNIRKKAYGTDEQPNEINGLAALRPMIERV